jgi:Na+-transporting methylmalonyl-CoA/oxaloacetate decarboxylase gamma subunit
MIQIKGDSVKLRIMFEKIKSANSNVALLTFEGAAFNMTFLALLLILVYPLTMVLKQQ